MQLTYRFHRNRIFVCRRSSRFGISLRSRAARTDVSSPEPHIDLAPLKSDSVAGQRTSLTRISFNSTIQTAGTVWHCLRFSAMWRSTHARCTGKQIICRCGLNDRLIADCSKVMKIGDDIHHREATLRDFGRLNLREFKKLLNRLQSPSRCSSRVHC